MAPVSTPLVLDRVWMHAREEDSGSTEVYRPEGYPSAPARGREGMLFRADGGFEWIAAGRDDRPGKAQGSWRSAADNPAHISVSVDGQRLEFEVVEASKDVLRLKRLSPR